MKYRTTKKAIKESGTTIYKIGYCNLQFLLRFNDPFAYSAGVNGWSCDYYRIGGAFDGVIISTGYDPIGHKVDYNIIKEYNEKARAINDNYNLPYEQREAKVKQLLNEFISVINK